jgi:hypothetical protein
MTFSYAKRFALPNTILSEYGCNVGWIMTVITNMAVPKFQLFYRFNIL